MRITDLIDFWKGKQSPGHTGAWAHELDRPMLESRPHTFNLDFPVSPYVGDIVNAKVLILGANAGYNPARTPKEFASEAAIAAYVARVDQPVGADWSRVAAYYDGTNYGHLIGSGQVALVNGCAYRSPKISEESENRKVADLLPSVAFTRRWLLEAVVPLCRADERLVIIKRGRLWKPVPELLKGERNVVADPAPVSSQITGAAWTALSEFLERQR